jgi:histidyl-tRNA synthetase
MKDILPAEMEIRDYVIGLIKETYRSFGFVSIETPCVEHLENLSSKQGGDNEKLIFKILKRGEKLKIDTAETEGDLVDGGLRYDLTVPLSRYYSNHANELPSPFKALQMGNVWRADRPQRGRYRQFMQCDIDILGEGTNLAEIELILATTTLLGKLDFNQFTIRINDRRILKAMAAYSGFEEKEYDEDFIITDKIDKIGLTGVEAELLEKGYKADSVEKYKKILTLGGVNGANSNNISEDINKLNSENSKTVINSSIEILRQFKEELSEYLEASVADGLEKIFLMVNASKSADFSLSFDPTLVRGMSYYTGTIFEISMDEFGGSVGGGGRYDEMIGKFTGQNTPACGFSIGFERIVLLLLERGYKVPIGQGKKAYLIEKNLSNEKFEEVLRLAKVERETGRQVQIAQMKKNKKFQKEQLVEDGYEEIVEIFND